MVSRVLFSVVCVLWVILLPVDSADYCGAFRDPNGQLHPSQSCGSQFCCGTCTRRSCCSSTKYRLTLDAQKRCATSPTTNTDGNDKNKSRLATLLGSILGSIFPILICVGICICCFAPCCLFYKKCRKGGNQGSQTPNTVVVNSPQQPFPQPPAGPGYQPSQPGYQPVPVDPGYGGQPMPTAPPSYNPGNPAPGMYPAMPPMAPYPGQPYATPFNPSYTGPH